MKEFCLHHVCSYDILAVEYTGIHLFYSGTSINQLMCGCCLSSMESLLWTSTTQSQIPGASPDGSIHGDS
jgi:hypothetical protein